MIILSVLSSTKAVLGMVLCTGLCVSELFVAVVVTNGVAVTNGVSVIVGVVVTGSVTVGVGKSFKIT